MQQPKLQEVASFFADAFSTSSGNSFFTFLSANGLGVGATRVFETLLTLCSAMSLGLTRRLLVLAVVSTVFAVVDVVGVFTTFATGNRLVPSIFSVGFPTLFKLVFLGSV